jgi:hypothetical protein
VAPLVPSVVTERDPLASIISNSLLVLRDIHRYSCSQNVSKLEIIEMDICVDWEGRSRSKASSSLVTNKKTGVEGPKHRDCEECVKNLECKCCQLMAYENRRREQNWLNDIGPF